MSSDSPAAGLRSRTANVSAPHYEQSPRGVRAVFSRTFRRAGRHSAYIFSCALLFMLTGGGCTGPSSGSPATADEPKSDQRMVQDSIRNTPPPGTVRVRARVDSCTTGATPPTCRLTLSTVLAYGMSTPTLGTRRSIEVRAPILQSRQATDDRQIRSGQEFRFLLRHREQPRLGDTSGPGTVWRIVEVR